MNAKASMSLRTASSSALYFGPLAKYRLFLEAITLLYLYSNILIFHCKSASNQIITSSFVTEMVIKVVEK